ncbi:glucose-6-phosphate dehydrogenase [Candidatus Blochmanniella vafra str. BVAF]|uniref:Glucose-6-phosphate 1-dehydrogenase n=1 Tax=Blochmanniella vafra (strain BVAF) TaxID=859654 RepID=E8Q715_BLOVB|nr:glucose-6-phosphate dehydrogenase [Candidatus Blochmannia vafer]ADV33839.1 glucose-6-phosphate dehydrogenase [Candidatus Blochmannia vafer str. BVAF]
MNISFETPAEHACNLIIFGAKGDLARRKLIPALYKLEKIGFIHPDTCILGVGRAEWDTLKYVKVIRSALEIFMREESIDENLWNRFSRRFEFCNLDINHTERFVLLINKLKRLDLLTINYLAMPPHTFDNICKGLSSIGLNKELNRVVIEKPLGIDLDSARVINANVSKYFSETQIYRIDHYLGKEAVLNLLVLRFANSLCFSNWNNSTIDHIQITVAEEVGIEGRWGYFDKIGQMRDMIQSHLLQILTIVAMSPPSCLSSDCIRDEKVKILRALRMVDPYRIHEITVRGQYVAGFIGGKPVPGYLEEKGANQNSTTETFVSIRVNIDSWRWFGVPFYLRTGKRLFKQYSEIVIYFKKPVLNLFSDLCSCLPNNKLIIRLQPNEGIDMQILSKVPGLGNKNRLKPVNMNLYFNKIFSKEYVSDAYERLLLEVMRGIQVLFVHYDEVEGSWKWVDSIVKAWEEQSSNSILNVYQAGTWGPSESTAMMLKDNRSWNEYISY